MKDLLHILLLAMIVCCWSCSGGEEEPIPTPTPKPEEKPKIELTTTVPVAPQEGETVTVTFTSTEAWTIDVAEGRAVSWCNVSPTSGSKGTNTLTITTTANDTYDERNAKVTIKAGTTSQSFTITQKQKDGLTVTSNKVEVDANGGDIAIEVKANVKFEYEIEKDAQSWITTNDSRALTASTLKFKVSENEETSKREGKIVIRSGELSETVTIYQEGSKPTIVLTQNEYTISSSGETIKVELKSNVNYEIQLPNVDWIKESSSRTMSAFTHYFEVDSNEEYDARYAEVLFVNKENGLSEKVMITQMQKDAIIVAKKEYTIEATGGSLDFEVNTNIDFIVTTSADWIVQNTHGRGLEAKSLSFTIAENTSDEAREGLITISSGELKQEIKVIQKVQSTFSVSQTEFNVASAGGKFGLNVSTNGEYTVTLPKVDWLNEITTRATSTYSHVFSVSANDTYDAREAEIIFTNKETGEVLKVKVIQAQRDAIIVANKEYIVEADGGSLDFEVNANVDFSVTTSVNWITQNTGSRGLKAKPLSFTIAENQADESREGLITISSSDLKQEIRVIQKEKFVFAVSETEFSISSNGGEISVNVITNGEYVVDLMGTYWVKETTNRSVSNYNHTFSILSNESYNDREANIRFFHKRSKETIWVKIYQSQKDAIIVEKNEYEFDEEGGLLEFNVNTNVQYDIKTSVDWISQVESRRLEKGTLVFTIAKNNTKKDREGEIILIYKDLSQNIIVKQSYEKSSGTIDDIEKEPW